jgi:hypothetical protein
MRIGRGICTIAHKVAFPYRQGINVIVPLYLRRTTTLFAASFKAAKRDMVPKQKGRPEGRPLWGW